MSKTLFWFALVLSAAGAACSSSEEPPASDNGTALILDRDLVGKPFGAAGAATKYGAAVGKPSPYLSDYYGLHVMQPIAKSTVIHDLVPREASLVEDRGNSVTLLLGGTYSIVFHFGKELRFSDGSVADSGHDYALFDSPDADHLVAALGAFQRALEERGVSKTYLIPNPHHDRELMVTAKAAAERERVTMTPDPDRARFRAAGPDAVLAVLDVVHGDEARYAEMLDIVETERIDWFGIEMYERGAQSTIDAFLSEPEDSAAFAHAKRALLDASWKKFASDGPNDNHYFRLLEVCRKRKIRAYGMDIERFYALFGHGEVPFGAMVRNSVWAEALPKSGRGVLFGGSAHFKGDAPVGGHPSLFVQDFLAPVYRGERLFVLAPR